MSEPKVSSLKLRCADAGCKSLSLMDIMPVWVNMEIGTFASSCLFPATWLSRKRPYYGYVLDNIVSI